MKIGALIHMYPPKHNAGGEFMLHSILKECVRRGHECSVTLMPVPNKCAIGSYELDGVSVGGATKLRDIDILVTHLDRTTEAEEYCRKNNIPLVQVFHNHHRPDMAKKIDLAVYNTDWIMDGYPVKGVPSLVCHPPIFKEDYLVETSGEYVTLVNLTREKGVDILYGLAEKNPKIKFLGVIGGYGHQIMPPEHLKNVTIMENQVDIRKAYEKTGILLMPSSYESYGRCAVEAAVNGIPVIAASTPGLLEALGDGGCFPGKLDVGLWNKALHEVIKNREEWSKRVREATAHIDPHYDIARVVGAMEAIVSSRR